jgi:ectoine hydroxylase-related dioxygenase (phytanoyl-CoA dioxygenase family)
MSDLPKYHSTFGGLWIDRSDWREQMSKRQLGDADRALVTKFVEDGYVILESAADPAALDAFQRRIAEAFRHGNRDVTYQGFSDKRTRRLSQPISSFGARVVDSYVPFVEALALFASPRLFDFLKLIFEDTPQLFQSLSFDTGSQQGLHQDTAYVVVEEPLKLAACWIALEDVKPGSGELMYAPGSHRLADWDFGGGRKHWKPDVDGNEPHDRWSRHLVEHAQQNRGVERFHAKKGDILVWHADLAHGGSPVENPELTRQSLVGHFCPASVRPYYFRVRELATVLRYGKLVYSSQHYDLSRAVPRALVVDE